MRGGRRLVVAFWLFAAIVATFAARAQTTKTKDEPRPRDDGPKVVSKAKASDSGKGSQFLVPPGADRYDPSLDDWSEIPAWRQTSFFGIRARGQVFIYVVDCSGSMIVEDRLARAKQEVRRSILKLQDPQKFKVIFYNDQPIAMPGDLPRSADQTSKNQLLAWLRLIEPDGETDPRAALGLALAMRPDAIFLLSDGEFPDGTVESLVRRNPRKIPIHCIDLSSDDVGDQLKRIARESGGQYVWRPHTGN